MGNQYPRNLQRDDDGFLTDPASCNEFLPDGRDNGVVNEVHDELDYHNLFVGQYAMGDVQFINYTSVNNAHSLYWKTSKNFVDGRLYHIVDSTFVNDPSDSYGQLQLLGPSGPFTFGILNTKFLGGRVGCGAICAGQHCGLGGSGGPCDVQYLLEGVDFSGLGDGARRIQFGVNAADPGFVLPIFVAKDNSLGGYRSIVSRHLSGFAALPGCQGSGQMWADGYGCSVPVRRLNLWGPKSENVRIAGAGYGVAPNWESPVRGINAGHMPFEPMHRGYGIPVVLGERYSLYASWGGDTLVELSDDLLAAYFGETETVQLEVGGVTCELRATDDTRFFSPLGLPRNLQILASHPLIRDGRLRCGSAGSSRGPAAPTSTPTMAAPSMAPTPLPTSAPTPAASSMPTPAPIATPAPALTMSPTASATPAPAPTPIPAPTAAPTASPTAGQTLALDAFVADPCGAGWPERKGRSGIPLLSANGVTFQGATIRTDGGVRLCEDCAARCWLQMAQVPCVGFVRTKSWQCTYFSRIDSVVEEGGDPTAVTTAPHVPAP